MAEREDIYDILYAEVMAANREFERAKSESIEAHRAAREALERAVQRYTDFSMEGIIPDDLKGQLKFASAE